jgi:hypothetical protein
LVHNDTAHSPQPGSIISEFLALGSNPVQASNKKNRILRYISEEWRATASHKSGFLRAWFHPPPFQIFFFFDLRPSFSLLSALWILLPSIAFHFRKIQMFLMFPGKEGKATVSVAVSTGTGMGLRRSQMDGMFSP